MKTIKNLETQEVKNTEISDLKKSDKKKVKKQEILKSFHFPKSEKIIMASSYKEALLKFNSITKNENV